MVYVERKVAAMLQQRLGPYLVGPRRPPPAPGGCRQADVQGGAAAARRRTRCSSRWRQSFQPPRRLPRSPWCRLVPSTTLFGLLGEPLRLQVADVNVAILVIFAITSMSVYGIVLAGWSSNSKCSLLGGLRSSAQMISYELSYGLALGSVLLMANSLSLTDIVNRQSRNVVWRAASLVRVSSAARVSDLT